MPDINFSAVAPLISLAVAALIVLILDLIMPPGKGRTGWYAAAVMGVLLSGWYSWQLWDTVVHGTQLPVAGGNTSAGLLSFVGAFITDRFSLLFNGIVLITTLLTVLISSVQSEEDASGYLALILWGATGMMVLAGATNLMTIFLGLELLSLALYVVVGFSKENPIAKEAAFKYLILGSVSSAFMLFGFALIYGATGDVSLYAIRDVWQQGVTQPDGLNTLFRAGLALSFVGFAFKLALAPFHVWAPDVYQGAPTPVTAFMSVGTKAAAFAVLARFVTVAAPYDYEGSYLLPLWILAALSMIVGNTAALPQTNLKRLLAFSGVAHAGYLLVALPGLTSKGLSAAIFYLFAYAFMNMGAFAVMVWLDRQGKDGAELSSYAGLAYRQPWVAGVMTLFMISLAGLPPTAGFSGKLLLLGAAFHGGAWALAVTLIVGTAISLYVYLKVVVEMFTPVGEGSRVDGGRSPAAAARRPGLPVGAVAQAAEIRSGDGSGADTAVTAGGRTHTAGSPPLALAGRQPAVRVEMPAWSSVALTIVLVIAVWGTLQLGLWPQPILSLVEQVLALP